MVLDMPEELFNHKSSKEVGINLAKERLNLIKQADIIVSNTMDFRSHVEPYSESALELGIGYGLKKELYCFMPDIRNCAERYQGEKHINQQGNLVDENGISFEPGPLNLMLEYSCKIVEGSFEDALKAIKQDMYGE